jgi:predicted  nucleic acid-binding Zn-ribbon protein
MIKKGRQNDRQEAAEMQEELQIWHERAKVLQRLLHAHAETSKKANEAIPEAKANCKRLENKVEALTKSVLEVSCCIHCSMSVS